MTFPGIDPATPNTARVVNALDGGRDNYAADREEAQRLLEICPQLATIMRENRAFLGRAVTWAAGQGVRQFADLGAGLPAAPAVHEVAQEADPAARVAYVDHDPLAVSHLRALYRAEGTAVLQADLTGPDAVLGDPALKTVIDLAQPVCVILGLVLGFLPARRAREVVAGYARLIAPGSVVVLSSLRFSDEGVWKDARAAFTAAPLRNHSPGQARRFLAGLELVPPGLTAAQGWRGGWRDAPVTRGGLACVLAAVARKP